MITEKLLGYGEYFATGLYEEPGKSLFYRKAMGLRRYYENCSLPKYAGEKLYPCGAVETPYYLDGLRVDFEKIENKDPGLAERIRHDVCKPYSSVPTLHTVGGDMYTHSMPNYERILQEGLGSYQNRIDRMEDRRLRDGLTHLLRGIQTYVTRCVTYLQSIGADEALIRALKRVPMEPARDLYEAVVCWNFVLYLDGCDNLGCVASGLYPYYRGEDIRQLLAQMFDNLDANEGWSMALGMDYNPLTIQCLEAAEGRRRPMIELFVDEQTPSEIWEKAFALIRSSSGQPAFYNPHVLLDGLQEKFGIAKEDIGRFCGGGCTEAMIAGLSNVGSLDAGINLPLILEKTMERRLTDCERFEDFYGAYLTSVREVVDDVMEQISQSQIKRAEYDPLPMRTLLIDDCIDRGTEYQCGGARYRWSVVNFAGLVNVIDGLLVIRDRVYAQRQDRAEALRKLRENDEEFLRSARTHPVCYGKDDPDANAFSAKLSREIFSMLDGKKPCYGMGYLPASIQFESQIWAGQQVGATPDGRKAYTPLADSLGAIFGKDIKGPTALLRSVTSLDLKKALGVPVLNFNINPNFTDDVLKTLILGYMKLGGIQMQITCISGELLEEAYKKPEEHKNLVVRVGGYSEYFYRLSDELKRMIIDRTIQNGV